MTLNCRKCLFSEASGSQATVKSGHWGGPGFSSEKVAAEKQLSYNLGFSRFCFFMYFFNPREEIVVDRLAKVLRRLEVRNRILQFMTA